MLSRSLLRLASVALFVALCCVISGCGGGAGTSGPEDTCGWIVGNGTSDAAGLVTIDMGELGTFRARVRDGLTSEPIVGVEYICVANSCEDDVSCVAVGGDDYQTSVFTYDRSEVVTTDGSVPGFWDDLFPWIGGESPMPGIHAVVSVPEETWNELRCNVAQEATDAVSDLDAGTIASALAVRLSGLVLATAYPQNSSSVLVYICYIDAQSPAGTLAELKDGVYLAQGYCPTQEVRLLELDGPCDSRSSLGLALIEPIVSDPGCVSSANLSTLHGVVKDATTGTGIPDVTVSVNGVEVTSGATGDYSVSDVIPSENVLVTASAVGYQPFSTVLVVGGNTTMEQDIVLVPSAASADQYRMVLTWGQDPSDLDSHLWVPYGSGYYHVAFWDKGGLATAPYAELDVDDMYSFGPETVTLLPEYAGDYIYAVHEWTGLGTLATSNAVVQIYAGNNLTHVLNVPTGECQDGWWWHVGRLNAQTGEFTLVNQLSPQPPVATRMPDGNVKQVVEE